MTGIFKAVKARNLALTILPKSFVFNSGGERPLPVRNQTQF
jgi:hypothetical protein